jgi:hypothetical protein
MPRLVECLEISDEEFITVGRVLEGLANPNVSERMTITNTNRTVGRGERQNHKY